MQTTYYKNITQPLDRLFAGLVDANTHYPVVGFSADVEEADAEYRIYADFPGIKKEDIGIEVEGNVLTISANFARNTDKENARRLTKERFEGKVERKFRLSRNVDSTGIGAKMKDGVLSLTLPKSAEAHKQQVTIK